MKSAQTMTDAEKLHIALKALREVADAIVENTTDTIWMPTRHSPNCTAFDWIFLTLREIDEGDHSAVDGDICCSCGMRVDFVHGIYITSFDQS
jgi:hypothetical protein